MQLLHFLVRNGEIDFSKLTLDVQLLHFLVRNGEMTLF